MFLLCSKKEHSHVCANRAIQIPLNLTSFQQNTVCFKALDVCFTQLYWFKIECQSDVRIEVVLKPIHVFSLPTSLLLIRDREGKRGRLQYQAPFRPLTAISIWKAKPSTKDCGQAGSWKIYKSTKLQGLTGPLGLLHPKTPGYNLFHAVSLSICTYWP